MFKLDDNFLMELGLGSLPAGEKNKMLSHIYETLEMKVGMRLAEKMSNEQLDEFEAFIGRNDEAGALKWLETNFPNYKEVVAEELEKLKGEIRQVAPQIIAQAASALPQIAPSQQAPNNPYPAFTAPQQPSYQPQEQTAPATAQTMPPLQPAYQPQVTTPPAQSQYGAPPAPVQQNMPVTPPQPPEPAQPFTPPQSQQPMPPYHQQPPAQQPSYQPAQFGAQPAQQQAPQTNFGAASPDFQQPSQTFLPPQADPYSTPNPPTNNQTYSQAPSYPPYDQQTSAAPPQPTINFAHPEQQNASASYGATQPTSSFGLNNQFAAGANTPAGVPQTQNPPEPYQPPR